MSRPETLQNEQELQELIAIYKDFAPKNTLEIGSFFGGTLYEWIFNAPYGAKICSIDALCHPTDGRYPRHKEAHERGYQSWADQKGGVDFRLIEGYSNDWESYRKLTSFLDGEELDFLFIDGDHVYASVKSDFEMYTPLVREGGIIAIHDIQHYPYHWMEVDRYWNEIKHKFHYKELMYDPNQFGIGIIYV